MKNSPGIIYLDNAATTRVVPEVADVVARCMSEDYGNPSSAHHVGIDAERAVETATREVLAAIGDKGGDLGDLIWTSGGTEADALGVLGPARRAVRRGKHLVFSAIEHPAVRASAGLLAEGGWETSVIDVDSAGVIDVDDTLALIRNDTTVVALMLVNNEIGTIQPVSELAARLRREHPEVHLHCDAVQALGKILVDVRELGADSIALAAHKIHGPKGVGALWIKKGAKLAPLWGGGGQQSGVRPGTLNVPGIAGMGAAARISATGLKERIEHFAALRESLLSGASASGVEFQINGGGAPCAPHIVSVAFRGVPAEPLLHVLESRGVMVSAGSACSERDRKPSPVLTAIGLPADFGTIRFSFGRETTLEHVNAAAEILASAVRGFS